MFKNPRNEAPTKYRPSFKKYGAKDFKFLRVLGKGRWGKAHQLYLSLLLSFGKVLLTELRGSQNYYAVKVGHLILEPHHVSDWWPGAEERCSAGGRWHRVHDDRAESSRPGGEAPLPLSPLLHLPDRREQQFFLISDNHPSLNVRDNIFQLSVPVTPILRDGVPERRRSHVPHPTTGQVSLSKYSCHSVQNFWVPLVHRTLVTTYSFSHRMPHLTAV